MENHAEKSSRLKGQRPCQEMGRRRKNRELSCHSSILRGKLSQVHSFDSVPGSKGKWPAFSMAFMAREESVRESLSPVCSVNELPFPWGESRFMLELVSGLLRKTHPEATTQ